MSVSKAIQKAEMEHHACLGHARCIRPTGHIWRFGVSPEEQAMKRIGRCLCAEAFNRADDGSSALAAGVSARY